jgi:hypothetical protein
MSSFVVRERHNVFGYEYWKVLYTGSWLRSEYFIRWYLRSKYNIKVDDLYTQDSMNRKSRSYFRPGSILGDKSWIVIDSTEKDYYYA